MFSIFAGGLLLLAAFFAGKLCQRIRLPAVTGYIVVGLLLGPGFLGVVTTEAEEYLEPVPHIALGLIALGIGASFSIRKVRRLGWGTLVIMLAELTGAFLLVTVALWSIGMPLPIALVLGAIAGGFLAWDLYFESKLHAERKNRRVR